MKRKVIKQGPSTLMVSLPVCWLKKYSISKGDLVDVEEAGSKLIFSTSKETDISSIVFDAKGLDIHHIRQYLTQIYKKGYDEVKVFPSPNVKMSLIQEFISKNLIGFEIVDQKEDFLVVRSISKALETEFDVLLRRSFLVTKQFAENLYEIIKTGEYEKLKEIQILEETNDKLTNFCQRLLNKRGYSDYSKTTFMYCVVWQFEKIADEYNYLCNYFLSHQNVCLHKKTLLCFENLIHFQNSVYLMYYSFDNKKAQEFTTKGRELIVECTNLLSDKTVDDNYTLGRILVLINRVFNLLGPIIGMNV
ncbi:MAG: hypothetical protein V1859_07925 [archaeon]